MLRRRRPGDAWTRDERRAAIAALLSAAMPEIRAPAADPGWSRHPDGHLTEIRLIADVCHNLPRADRPPRAGEYDGLVPPGRRERDVGLWAPRPRRPPGVPRAGRGVTGARLTRHRSPG